jgi:polyphenol oxidase
MIRRKAGKIEWLEFELLQEFPPIKHGVFLRHGGVSAGPFSSLNAGSRGEDNAVAIRNRELIREILNIRSFAICDQPHQANVAFLPHAQDDELKICDGMITNRSDEGLLIRHADCQAALFYDPVTSTIANVHAGWRGNVQNIYAATVEKMTTSTGAKRENIRVCVSPSLGPDRSEFIHYRTELPEHFWPFQIRPTYFNLWEIGRHQLLQAGILPRHIQFAEICTYSNPADFFSFRRDKRLTGGHATVIALV